MTTEAVRELGIASGAQVQILVKATEVSLAVGEVSGLSIRNQIPGTITAIDQGGAMAVVKIVIEGGETITSAITKAAVGELGLAAGSEVTVLVKSTEISIAAPWPAVDHPARCLDRPSDPIVWSTEDSPSGLGRTLGKRVGGNPSRVRISHPPPFGTRRFRRVGHPRPTRYWIIRSHFRSQLPSSDLSAGPGGSSHGSRPRRVATSRRIGSVRC